MRTVLLFVSLACFAGRAMAQNAAPAQASPFTSVDGAFFALSVADLPASVKWYSEKLGLKTTITTGGPDGGSVTVLEGNGLIVELVHLPKAAPLTRAAPSVQAAQDVHGFFKAGVLVGDFEGLVARLREHGVEIAFGPFPARNGQRANLIVKDNAGNLIQFFSR